MLGHRLNTGQPKLAEIGVSGLPRSQIGDWSAGRTLRSELGELFLAEGGLRRARGERAAPRFVSVSVFSELSLAQLLRVSL